MKLKTIVSQVLATATFYLPSLLAAQGGGGTTTSGAAAIPASSGTYSIESEILAYQALRTNSQEIAGEVSALNGTTDVLLVPSTSTAVPAFQVWRSHMVIVQNYLKQSQNLLNGGDGCPIARQPGAAPPSFAAYTTAIGEGVTALQSILSLFANSQSVNEFTGTIQDQAVLLGVARSLRESGVDVLTPDMYGPSTIGGVDSKTYPFVKNLSTLIDRHSALQKAYVCNAVAATAVGQVQQAEIARETDYAKLAKLGKDKDDAPKFQPLLDDIAAQTGILALVRSKLGLGENDLNQINAWEQEVIGLGRTVGDPKVSDQDRQHALQNIHNNDIKIANLEMPAITQINLKVAQIMSLVTGIESYLAGLTGGSITLTPPVAPSSASTPAASGGTQATGGGTQGGQTPTASATPSASNSSSSSSTPTIIAVLQADGLAAKMGFEVADDGTVSSDQLNGWRIVWLKALESGGSIINQANILGSHPYFGGGAVSGYAMYQFDGQLLCAANVASYGGYVKAKKFPKLASSDHVIKSIELNGNCATRP